MTMRVDKMVSGICRQCGYQTPTVISASCPECGGPIGADVAAALAVPAARGRLPEMLYQNAYCWFILVSALDLMLTWVVLLLDGQEVNVLARAVLGHMGLGGLILFKFCLVVFVVIMCEWTGRRNYRAGRRLSEWAVAITSIPVALSFAQLWSAL